MVAQYDATLVNLVDHLDTLFSDGIQVHDIVPAVSYAMVFVQKVDGLTGIQKRDMVVCAIETMMHRKGISDAFINIVEPTIESLLSVDKGKLTFTNPNKRSDCVCAIL